MRSRKSYAEARAKFRTTAAAAGAALTTYVNPNLGPAGETLATDVARFGPADAPGVMIVNSGTHGRGGLLRFRLPDRLDGGWLAAAPCRPARRW